MVTLDPAEAKEQFDRVIGNITLMLRQYIVHADLSAHNILYWNGVARLIDLPQAVAADKHPERLNCSRGTSITFAIISQNRASRAIRRNYSSISGTNGMEVSRLKSGLAKFDGHLNFPLLSGRDRTTSQM